VFPHILNAAAQLLRLGGVRRVDGRLLVNDAVVAVARRDYLHQPLVDGVKRVHAYRRGGETHTLCNNMFSGKTNNKNVQNITTGKKRKKTHILQNPRYLQFCFDERDFDC